MIKSIFKRILLIFSTFWRTIVSTLVRKEDVDNDGKQEIIVDLNGKPSPLEETSQTQKEDADYDNCK